MPEMNAPNEVSFAETERDKTISHVPLADVAALNTPKAIEMVILDRKGHRK